MTDIEPLREFIRRQYLYDDTATLDGDDPIFPDVVDSLGVMELLDFVEERYGIQIPESELVAGNFRTLNSVAGLIERQRR